MSNSNSPRHPEQSEGFLACGKDLDQHSAKAGRSFTTFRMTRGVTSKKRCFVFCHGFGFDPSFWNPLRLYFSQSHAIYLDLGYFGEENRRIPNDESTEYIGIGHSLGLKTLMSLNLPFKSMIALQGFVHFTGFDVHLHRHRSRELIRLTRDFTVSPELTLNQFYQRTGVGMDLSTIRTLNQVKLTDALASLAVPASMPIGIPMLVLGSNDDKIVPPELIEDNFAHHPQVTIDIINQAQHGLGHIKPDVVYQKVRNFLGDE